MARTARVLLPVLSAALFQLAFPPFNLGPLVFVCLVPWFWHLSTSTHRGAFKSGYLMGFLIVLAQMAFLSPLVTHWTGSTLLGMLPWLACGFIGAFYFAFAGILIRYAMVRRRYWAIPFVWAGIEVFRSYVPCLAFPWFILATPLWPYPAIDQLAFFGTIYLVSGWVCLANVAIFIGLKKQPLRCVAYSIPALLCLLISLVWYMRPIPGRTFRVVVGQPGFDLAFGDQTQRPFEIRNRVEQLIAVGKENHASLLVLPEGIVEGGSFPPDTPFALDPTVPTLFGGQRGTGPAYQTAFLYDEGKWTYADKSRLVVFGEYVPGRDYIPFLSSFKLPAGDLRAAEKVSALKVDGVVVGPMICFEGLFWDVAHAQSQNGAQLLAIMSIDDWYMGTAAPDQLKYGAMWRAIETGLPVVRSASLGYTLVVDAKGRVTSHVPLQGLKWIVADVTVQDDPLRNPARSFFPWALGAFPFGLLAWAIGARARARRREAL